MMNPTLTAEMLGIPKELFDDVQHLVSVTQRTGGFSTITRNVRLTAAEIAALNAQYKKDRVAALAQGKPVSSVPAPSFYKLVPYVVPTSNTVPFGMYVLNYVHDLIWESDYTYQGKTGDMHLFTKKSDNFLASDGQTYQDYDQEVRIYKKNGKWIISRDNELPKYLLEVPAPENLYIASDGKRVIPMKLRQYTVEEIAAELKWTVQQVLDHDLDYLQCEERNPSTYITSIFPRFNESAEFGTYVSGILGGSELLANRISNIGRPIADYDIEMMALNGCERPADAVDADSQGNAGECKDQWYETEAEARTFTFDFDLTKDVAVVVAAVEVSAPNGTPNGHYERWHAYYDVKNQRIMQSPSDDNA